MEILTLTAEQIAVSLEDKDGELRLDSRVVCAGFGLPNHTSYRNSVLVKYEKDFEELGVIFKLTQPTGEIVWFLNEDQVSFAGTLTKNTDRAVKFKLSLVKAFRIAREKAAGQKYPRQLVGDVPANPTQQLVDKINIVFDGLFATVDDLIRTGMKIEAMIAVDPTLRPILEPHKPKMLIEAALLSPTELGKLMEQRDGISRSGQAMNKLLIEKGLQVSTGDKALAYRAIGQGVEFSKVVADTAKGHAKTVQSLRWYESVIDLLVN